MEPFATVAAGDVLVGKYRVERLIGQGGMGVVVEARHLALDERVAIKFLLPDLAQNPEASERFLREARAAVRIKSPHVAKVSDVGTLENGSPYMVMEFLVGEDASGLLQRNGPMRVEDAVDLLVQACDAIAEAHAQGIVHRDIKPANLFITRHADGSPFVKVLDFGISKVMGEQPVDQLTRTTATLGSALYMSPEQIKQSRSVDQRTDIYALGVTLFELLTGAYPFMADTYATLVLEIATGTPRALRELRPDLPEDLVRAVERAFAREREQRFQTVGELAMALAPFAPQGSRPIIERIVRLSGGAAPVLPTTTSTGTAVQAGTNAQFGQSRTNPDTGAAPRKSALPLVVGGVAVLAVAAGIAAVAFGGGRGADVAAALPESAAAPVSAASPPPPPPVPPPAVATPAPPPEVAPSASTPPPPSVKKPSVKVSVAAPKLPVAPPPAPKPAPAPAPKSGLDLDKR